MIATLVVNGIRPVFEMETTVDQMLAVAQGHVSMEALADWLRTHT